MNLSERLRVSRERADLTQREVSKRTSINHKTISNWENGVSNPDPDSISRLADIYNVSVDYLFGKVDDINFSAKAQKKQFSNGWLSVPVGGAIAAGTAINSPSAPCEEYVDIPPAIAQGHTVDDFLCVIAKGESMEPTILDGDRLVFLRDNELHGSKQIHAVSFGDDFDYTAKLVKQDEDGNVLITALNQSAWEPMMLSPARAKEKNLRIHGYLVYLSRVNFL